MIDWQKIRSEFEQEDITLKALAEKYKLSPSTVRSRKNRDGWQRNGGENVATRRNATDQPGGQNNNQNAKGNSGNPRAAPPPGNKNAVSTGEHETIFADTLTDEEKEIYSNLDDEPSFILIDEIRILKIRQRRMMNRISEAEKGLDETETRKLQQLRKLNVPSDKDPQQAEVKIYAMKDVEIETKTFRKIDNLLALEDALTRVSNALTKTVKQLKDLELTDRRAQLTDMQITKMKNDMGYDSENPDSIVIVDAWSDQDE